MLLGTNVASIVHYVHAAPRFIKERRSDGTTGLHENPQAGQNCHEGKDTAGFSRGRESTSAICQEPRGGGELPLFCGASVVAFRRWEVIKEKETDSLSASSIVNDPAPHPPLEVFLTVCLALHLSFRKDGARAKIKHLSSPRLRTGFLHRSPTWLFGSVGAIPYAGT